MTMIDAFIFAIIALLVSSTTIVLFEAGLLLVNKLIKRSGHRKVAARAFSE